MACRVREHVQRPVPYATTFIGVALVVACLAVAWTLGAEPSATDAPGPSGDGDGYDGPPIAGVFDSCLPGCDLYSVRSDSSEVANLTGTDREMLESEPALSPEGSVVAYTCAEPGHEPGPPSGPSPRAAAICRVAISGGEPEIFITEEGADLSGPAWSPDGSQLVYAFTRGDGWSGIGTLEADGARRTLTDGHDIASGPTWSPTNDEIAFVCGRGSEPPSTRFCTIPAGGGDVAEVAAIDADCGSPTFAPDGFILGVVCAQPGADRGDIFIASVTEDVVMSMTGDGQVALEGGSRPRWSQDGWSVFVRRDDALWMWAAEARRWSQPPLPPLHGGFDVITPL